MATLIFSALGSVFGGPLGGAIGALIGRQIDSTIIGSPSREGPRLKDLSVTTSTYGMPIPRHFGRMRVAGSIIWATDLKEQRSSSGGGKGRPSVTTYSYSASFAVAIGSGPVDSIGRIWADGNLLRGASFDMKTGGQIRFHTGAGDQAPDPLLAAAEAAGQCPAYRGIAYVVFEDLQLADFGNRIPTLNFEVMLGDGADLNMKSIVDGVIDDIEANVPLSGIKGISCEGPIADLVSQLAAVLPVDCDVAGETLTLAGQQSAVHEVGDATVTTADDGFGGQQGFARKRLPSIENPPQLIRYYDVARDYQPGAQRVVGRPAPGQPSSVELPVACDAISARGLIEQAALNAAWARQTISWRTAELDPEVRPGALVHLPGQTGAWRVTDWEWRASGIELTLWRNPPLSIVSGASPSSDPGRSLSPVDEVAGPTVLAAYELPWDGSGSGDLPLVYAAASSATAGWQGAALYLDGGDGQLAPLGSTGKTRALIGTSTIALPPGSPHLFDRTNTVLVQLAATDQVLQDATIRQLAQGANRALVGEEIIQFAHAVPLGSGHWRLEGLLRGRGGTEAGIHGHTAGERFVVLDAVATALNGSTVGANDTSTIAAIGLGDETPVSAPVQCRGLTRRPLFPVHTVAALSSDGALHLRWARRARGALTWLDGVETPLHEELEAYDVLVGPPDQPYQVWTVASSEHVIAATDVASLTASHPGAQISVRQRGSYAVSLPALLIHLS